MLGAKKQIEEALSHQARKKAEQAASEVEEKNKTANEVQRQQQEDVENLRRFNEYKGDIVKFLQEVNEQVLYGHGRVENWHRTKSAHKDEFYYPSSWDGVNQLPYKINVHETEQLEARMELLGKGAIGIALVLADRVGQMGGPVGAQYKPCRPQSIMVNTTSAEHLGSIEYCPDDKGIDLGLEKEEFFKNLETLVLSKVVQIVTQTKD